jgi:hypothetical protein
MYTYHNAFLMSQGSFHCRFALTSGEPQLACRDRRHSLTRSTNKLGSAVEAVHRRSTSSQPTIVSQSHVTFASVSGFLVLARRIVEDLARRIIRDLVGLCRAVQGSAGGLL